MFRGLQVGRGVAALLVVLHHCSLGANVFYGNKPFSGFWEFGYIGVDFFFVLSGFIIYWVHSGDTKGVQSALSYFKKRIIRIYPPFIVISVVLLAVYSIFPQLSAADRKIGIMTSMLLIPTPPFDPALSVSWTLMHEMLFYVVFLIYYSNRTFFYGVISSWALLILLSNFCWTSGPVSMSAFLLHTHNIQFLFGIFSAIVVQRNRQHYMYLLAGMLMLMLMLFIAGWQVQIIKFISPPLLTVYLGFCFMFVVIGLCSIEKKVSYPEMLFFMGTASYSIYLIHNPVISLLNRLARKIYVHVKLPPEVFFLFIAIISIGVGIGYYFLWERPSLKYLKSKSCSKAVQGAY